MAYHYLSDIRDINKWAQDCPANLARLITFVLATIQQKLETVPAIVDSFSEYGGESLYAFGSKADGLDYVTTRQADIYAAALAAAQLRDDYNLLRAFLRVPGIGLVKAGFCAQLFAGRVGCLDVHNLKLYDIPLRAVRLNKRARPDTQRRHIDKYIALCRTLGGSTFLWSAWCKHVSRTRRNNWHHGGYVSYFHVAALLGSYDVGVDSPLGLC